MSKPLSMYTIIGVGEVRSARILMILSTVIVGLSITIAYLINMAIDLNKQIAFLKDQQIMYGIPNADGYFVSTTKLPDNVVLDWAEAMVSNCYNFDPLTANANLDDCKRRLSPELLMTKEAMVDNNKVIARNQVVTQMFSWGQKRLIEEQGGYTFQVRGALRRLQGSTPYFNEMIEVSVKVSKQQPTASRPLGLVAAEWSERIVTRGQQ